MAIKNDTHRGAHGLHRRLTQRRCIKVWRVTGGDQQLIAFANRHLEVGAQLQHEFATRPRPSRLNEARVPRRNARLRRELKLGEPPPFAPLANQGAWAGRRHSANQSRTLRKPTNSATPKPTTMSACPMT